MTDHLSTIRQYVAEIRRHAWKISGDVEGCCNHISAACDALEAELDMLKLGRDGISPEDYDRLITRCDALKAERLTPEEADTMRATTIPPDKSSSRMASWRSGMAKLERWAGEVQ